MSLTTRLERLERARTPVADTPRMRANAAKGVAFDHDAFARVFAELTAGLSEEELAEWARLLERQATL